MDTKKLRQKILDLAIRGKLVPQDPNDEPASVLLERIRAEKERLIKEGKIKRSKKSASDTPQYENRQVGEANAVPFEVPESWEWTTIEDATINRDAERIPVSLAVRKTLAGGMGITARQQPCLPTAAGPAGRRLPWQTQTATEADGSSPWGSCRGSPDGTPRRDRSSAGAVSPRPGARCASSVRRQTPFQ